MQKYFELRLPRCENRRWILSKALPRIYGDRLDVTAKHDAGDGWAELLKALNGKTRDFRARTHQRRIAIRPTSYAGTSGNAETY